VEGIKIQGKDLGGWWKYSVHMCAHGKMKPVETIAGMGKRG
jgi:hypothetical protein